MNGSETADPGTLRKRVQARTPSVDALWRDVLSGRLTLLRHRYENGRRYLYLQLPSQGQLRGTDLTERERLVVGYRAYGQGLKRIAFELGVSVPTITRCLSRALAKMGLSSDVQLPAVLGAGLRRR